MADEAMPTDGQISDDSQVVDQLLETVDDPMVLKDQLQKQRKANFELRQRTKSAEEKVRELETRTPQKTESSTITNQTTAAIGDKDYVELRMAGYTTDDVTDIMRFGGMDALKDPNSLLSQGIKARQEQRKAEQAANGTNQSGGEDQLREFNFNLPRNPSLTDLKKSIADMEKALPHEN